MEDIFDILSEVTGITKYSGSEVITPKEIVADMVDLLPAEIFAPEARFLDPAVKSGRFLAEIYRRLMDSDAMKQVFPNEQERERHILDNQLYGFATSAVAATVARKQLYNDPTIAGNIAYTDGYPNSIKSKDFGAMIQGAFGIMKFDVIIGNPPYNGGIDYKFINKAIELKPNYISFIHPARWKSAIDVPDAIRVQKAMLDEKHLKEIHCFEAWNSNKTIIWPGTRTGSVNFWLIDLNNTYELVDTYVSMSSRNYSEQPLYAKRKGKELFFPYFCMNPIVLGIIEKVLSHPDFQSIKWRFTDSGDGDVNIANTLYTAYESMFATDDSKRRNFNSKDIENINTYLSTPFWRALTRQFMKGFHSCDIRFMDYLPDFDFGAIKPTETYIENYFGLDKTQIEYLKNYSSNIADAP